MSSTQATIPEKEFYYLVVDHNNTMKLFRNKEDALMAAKAELNYRSVREVRLRDNYLDTSSTY